MKKFYKNKTVLITGHTGFKGSWLALIMFFLGAKVIGISLKPINKLNLYSLIKKFIHKNYICDLKDYNNFSKIIYKHKPDIIFHLAAQALVFESYKNPHYTFNNNITVTLNLLEILRNSNKKLTCIFITSDKVYKNQELDYGYIENSPLGGFDPYSASKASIEILIESYKQSYFLKNNNIKLAIARAGNVIGGGDWSENRIIPDAMKNWSKGEKFLLRNPNATRPWQHVLEPLIGYTKLAYLLNKKKSIQGEVFNFGPTKKNTISVYSLIEILGMDWFGVNFKKYLKIKNVSQFKETKSLILNSNKAKLLLDWKCNLNFKESILMTSKWYSKYYNDKNKITDFTINQIKEYIDKYV